MRIITNSDYGKEITLSLYELFLVEIPYNPSSGEYLSGPSFQKQENCKVIKEFFIPDNSGTSDSLSKKVYLMLTTSSLSSLLYWFFSAPNYVSQFSIKLTVLPLDIS